jgi:CheY-like chemotaxis protein
VTASSRRKTILIIDDDPDVRMFVSGLMKSSGYRAMSAENRISALEKASRQQPDCIILNCMMDGEDGMALYKTLKTHDELKQIPVVMVSPVSEEIISQHWILRQAAVAGPDGFVQSPPEAGKIIEIIGSLTGRTDGFNPPSE